MPLVSDLDPTTAPTPDTEELDAWGALQALRTPPPASVDPATADAFRQRSRQVLADYKAKQERVGAPLFPEHTARANKARQDQLRGLFLGDLAETLDPERYAALQHRAGQTGDPEAYIARQSLKTYLKATTGQDLAPHHYPLARRQLAQALGVEDGDKPVREAIAERFRRHDADTKLLQASATQIAETVIGGDLELADQLTADLLPQFSPEFREAARAELATARAESLRTVRAATPHARRLTEILGFYMGRGEEAFQRTEGQRVSLDYDTAAEAVEYLNTLPPEVRDVAISLAGRELETLGSQQGTIATAGETTATRTKLLGTQAANYLTALWATYRQGVLQGIPGEAAEAARTLERRRFEEFDQRFQTRAALIGTAGSVPTYEPSDSWAQKAFLAGSAQVPTFAAFFSPASLGALGLSMAGQSLEAQRLQNPDGSFQGQLGSASISAALQLGAERAFTGQGLKFLRGKSPTVASMLSRAGIRGKYLRGITGGTMNAAAAGVTEYSEEILQDGIDRLFSDVQRELDGVSTTATTAPGTWFREWLEPWAPGSGSRQAEETFYAILPFALIGAGLAGSYQHFRYGDFLQQSGTMLRAVGVPGPVIEEIQKADPETAARLTKEAFDAGLEETTAAQRAKALEAFRESARLWAESGMPVVYPDEADDGTPVYVFQADPAGQRATRRIFDTEEEALLAWQQAKNQIDEAALLASVQAAQGAALEQTFGEGAALEGKGQAIPLDQRAPALRAASKIKDAFGQPLITAAQIAARVQQFLVQGGQRKDVDNLVVKARRHAVRLADGITRQILQYFTDTDAVAILEDAAEAFADQAIADSMLDPAELADQIRAAEAATGSTYLQADYDPATYLEDPTPLLEAFSAIARDYTFASIRSEQMPAELRDWISTTAIASGQTFAYAEELRRSPKLAKAIAEGRIDARFESLLADAIGIDQAARDARLEAAYRAQLAAEAMEGIPEIATAAKGKLPHPQTLRDRSHPLTGEVQRIYDALKRPTRQTTKAGRPVMRTNEANAFFLPYGEMVDLDQVRASLNELGFSFDTPADLLTALDESLNYGNKTFATQSIQDDPSAPSFALSPSSLNRIEGAIAAKMAEGPAERADYYTRLRDRLAGVLIRYKEFALAAGATDAEQALRKAREAIAETSAIIQALPAEARGRVTLPVSDILDAKTQRGRVTAMLRLIDQADAALETTLQDQYREALAKLLDLAKPDVNPATRQARSRLTPETQREVMAIYEVMALLPEEAGIRQFNAENDLQRAEDRLNATDPDDTEAMKKAQAEYIAAALTKNRLDTFGAVLGGSAAELARAHDALLQLYKTGRYARNILDDQRRQELAAMREEVLATLKPVDQPTHSRRTSKAGFGEGFASWIFGHKSFHDVMEALFPNSTTARHLQDLARRADTGVKRAHIAARERWEQWARTALDLPRRNWRLKLQTILADLSKRRDFNIEIREGVKFREESLDEEQAIAILEGRMKPGWQDDPMAMQSLRQALADFRILRDRDKKRVRKVRFQRLTSRGAPAFLHLSDLEATYILQLAAQKDYAATLDAYGFTEEVLHQLMLATDERALRIGDFLQREYAAEYDRLNPVFRELYGMDMPRIRNYAPARFHHQNATPDLDPEAGEGVMVNALSSGFTRNRVHHLARPRQKNALDLYWEHIQQVEYFIHWASVVRELRAVFLNPRVRFALEGNFGEKAAKDFYTWIDVLAADGNLSAAAARTNQELTRRMQLGLAAAGLAFNVGSVFKQFQAALNGLLEMTTRETLLGLKEALRNPELFATAWHSETIQQRIEEGFGPEDRRVLDAANAKPSVIFELYRIGRLPLAWNDAAATTLYAAAAYGVHYRKAIDEGKMTPEAAREHALAVMDRVVKRTAQPATTQDRSLAELTVGRFGMLLGYIFRSDPRQKFAIAARTVEDLRAGRISKRTAARRLLFSWFNYGFMNEALSDLWASVSRDDDPDRWDWRDYLSSSLAGPLSGAGVLGNMAEALIRGTIGTGFFGGTTYTAQAGDLMAYHHGSRLVSTLIDEADADLGDLIKAALSDARDYSTIFSGLDPRAAAPAVGFRILRDSYGILDNWTETEAERQDNILAEYKQTQKLEREAAALERDRTAPVLTPQERALRGLKVAHRAAAIQRIVAPMTEAERRDYLARLQDLGILTTATRQAME